MPRPDVAHVAGSRTGGHALRVSLPMIEVSRLTRDFQTNGKTLRAVDHLSFRVAAGEVYGLLGPNGAGKTTALRMILGLLPPTSGEAWIDGYSAQHQPQEVKSRIGLVSATAGLYPWLTPRETLQFFADLYGLAPRTAAARIDELAALFDMQAFLDQRSATLSTGQRQRVILARALVHDPPVMLLDEPTRGLDVVGIQVVFDYLRHLRTQRKAVILCTHALDEAQRTCDRFGLLHQGRLRLEGNLPELRAHTGCESLMDMFLKLLAAPAPREDVSP
jgi:ABC-2 type transport system ATP-binding protein/sodium transport system ATP-binding protein